MTRSWRKKLEMGLYRITNIDFAELEEELEGSTVKLSKQNKKLDFGESELAL